MYYSVDCSLLLCLYSLHSAISVSKWRNLSLSSSPAGTANEYVISISKGSNNRSLTLSVPANSSIQPLFLGGIKASSMQSALELTVNDGASMLRPSFLGSIRKVKLNNYPILLGRAATESRLVGTGYHATCQEQPCSTSQHECQPVESGLLGYECSCQDCSVVSGDAQSMEPTGDAQSMEPTGDAVPQILLVSSQPLSVLEGDSGIVHVNVTPSPSYSLAQGTLSGLYLPTAGTNVSVAITGSPRFGKLLLSENIMPDEPFPLTRLLSNDVRYVQDGSEETLDSVTMSVETEQKLVLSSVTIEVRDFFSFLLAFFFNFVCVKRLLSF